MFEDLLKKSRENRSVNNRTYLKTESRVVSHSGVASSSPSSRLVISDSPTRKNDNGMKLHHFGPKSLFSGLEKMVDNSIFIGDSSSSLNSSEVSDSKFLDDQHIQSYSSNNFSRPNTFGLVSVHGSNSHSSCASKLRTTTAINNNRKNYSAQLSSSLSKPNGLLAKSSLKDDMTIKRSSYFNQQLKQTTEINSSPNIENKIEFPQQSRCQGDQTGSVPINIVTNASMTRINPFTSKKESHMSSVRENFNLSVSSLQEKCLDNRDAVDLCMRSLNKDSELLSNPDKIRKASESQREDRSQSNGSNFIPVDAITIHSLRHEISPPTQTERETGSGGVCMKEQFQPYPHKKGVDMPPQDVSEHSHDGFSMNNNDNYDNKNEGKVDRFQNFVRKNLKRKKFSYKKNSNRFSASSRSKYSNKYSNRDRVCEDDFGPNQNGGCDEEGDSNMVSGDTSLREQDIDDEQQPKKSCMDVIMEGLTNRIRYPVQGGELTMDQEEYCWSELCRLINAVSYIDLAGFEMKSSSDKDEKKKWEQWYRHPNLLPCCPGHNMPCRLWTVRRKDSLHRGRLFYSCSFPYENQCSFFLWADQNPALLKYLWPEQSQIQPLTDDANIRNSEIESNQLRLLAHRIASHQRLEEEMSTMNAVALQNKYLELMNQVETSIENSGYWSLSCSFMKSTRQSLKRKFQEWKKSLKSHKRANVSEYKNRIGQLLEYWWDCNQKFAFLGEWKSQGSESTVSCLDANKWPNSLNIVKNHNNNKNIDNNDSDSDNNDTEEEEEDRNDDLESDLIDEEEDEDEEDDEEDDEDNAVDVINREKEEIKVEFTESTQTIDQFSNGDISDHANKRIKRCSSNQSLTHSIQSLEGSSIIPQGEIIEFSDSEDENTDKNKIFPVKSLRVDHLNTPTLPSKFSLPLASLSEKSAGYSFLPLDFLSFHFPSLKMALPLFWNWSDFRPGQEPAIDAVLRGESLFIQWPTASGKSLVPWLTTLSRPSLTILVSPLTSLVEDQLRRLPSSWLPAWSWSSLSTSSLSSTWKMVRSVLRGHCKLIYISPESLTSPSFLSFMRFCQLVLAWKMKRKQQYDHIDRRHESMHSISPWLLVVDEAHCLSQWAFQFRPEFRLIGKLFGGEWNNIPASLAQYQVRFQRLAMTATASPTVQREICELLNIQHRGDHFITTNSSFVTTWERIDLQASQVASDQQYEKLIVYILSLYSSSLMKKSATKHSQPSSLPSILIYVSKRWQAERVATHLKNRLGLEIFSSSFEYNVNGLEFVAAYHGGLSNKDRLSIQEKFHSGKLSILVATIAFGLGIDPPRVRTVIHFHCPSSLESYVQEVGRAGRDGGSCQAVMYISPDECRARLVEFWKPEQGPLPIYAMITRLFHEWHQSHLLAGILDPRSPSLDFLVDAVSLQGSWNSWSMASGLSVIALKTLFVYLASPPLNVITLIPIQSWLLRYKLRYSNLNPKNMFLENDSTELLMPPNLSPHSVEDRLWNLLLKWWNVCTVNSASKSWIVGVEISWQQLAVLIPNIESSVIKTILNKWKYQGILDVEYSIVDFEVACRPQMLQHIRETRSWHSFHHSLQDHNVNPVDLALPFILHISSQISTIFRDRYLDQHRRYVDVVHFGNLLSLLSPSSPFLSEMKVSHIKSLVDQYFQSSVVVAANREKNEPSLKFIDLCKIHLSRSLFDELVKLNCWESMKKEEVGCRHSSSYSDLVNDVWHIGHQQGALQILKRYIKMNILDYFSKPMSNPFRSFWEEALLECALQTLTLKICQLLCDVKNPCKDLRGSLKFLASSSMYRSGLSEGGLKGSLMMAKSHASTSAVNFPSNTWLSDLWQENHSLENDDNDDFGDMDDDSGFGSNNKESWYCMKDYTIYDTEDLMAEIYHLLKTDKDIQNFFKFE